MSEDSHKDPSNFTEACETLISDAVVEKFCRDGHVTLRDCVGTSTIALLYRDMINEVTKDVRNACCKCKNSTSVSQNTTTTDNGGSSDTDKPADRNLLSSTESSTHSTIPPLCSTCGLHIGWDPNALFHALRMPYPSDRSDVFRRFVCECLASVVGVLMSRVFQKVAQARRDEKKNRQPTSTTDPSQLTVKTPQGTSLLRMRTQTSRGYYHMTRTKALRRSAESSQTVRVRLYHDQLVCKRASVDSTSWHQDSVYWPFHPEYFLSTVTVWVPMRDVTQGNGALKFVNGSHAFGSPHAGRCVPVWGSLLCPDDWELCVNRFRSLVALLEGNERKNAIRDGTEGAEESKKDDTATQSSDNTSRTEDTSGGMLAESGVKSQTSPAVESFNAYSLEDARSLERALDYAMREYIAAFEAKKATSSKNSEAGTPPTAEQKEPSASSWFMQTEECAMRAGDISIHNGLVWHTSSSFKGRSSNPSTSTTTTNTSSDQSFMKYHDAEAHSHLDTVVPVCPGLAESQLRPAASFIFFCDPPLSAVADIRCKTDRRRDNCVGELTSVSDRDRGGSTTTTRITTSRTPAVTIEAAVDSTTKAANESQFQSTGTSRTENDVLPPVPPPGSKLLAPPLQQRDSVFYWYNSDYQSACRKRAEKDPWVRPTGWQKGTHPVLFEREYV